MFQTAIKTFLICCLFQNKLIQSEMVMSDAIRQMTSMLHKHCKSESGVTEEHIDASRSGHLSSDPEFKCYIACTMEFIGIMDSDGNISYDHIYDLLPTETKEIVDTITTKCSGICKICFLFVLFFDFAQNLLLQLVWIIVIQHGKQLNVILKLICQI